MRQKSHTLKNAQSFELNGNELVPIIVKLKGLFLSWVRFFTVLHDQLPPKICYSLCVDASPYARIVNGAHSCTNVQKE